MPIYRHRLDHRSRRGLTLVEVLVGLAILTAGMLALATIIPSTLKSHDRAELLTVAAMLAQTKAEEIRRDDSLTQSLQNEIRNLRTPTTPIKFIQEPRLTYSFSGSSLQYALLNDPSLSNELIDPRARDGIARVIIRYAEDFSPDQEVLYELRF